jgi:hypothetical protein
MRYERPALWELRCNAVACSLSFSASGVDKAGQSIIPRQIMSSFLDAPLSRDQARRLNQKPSRLSFPHRSTTRSRIRKKKKTNNAHKYSPKRPSSPSRRQRGDDNDFNRLSFSVSQQPTRSTDRRTLNRMRNTSNMHTPHSAYQQLLSSSYFPPLKITYPNSSSFYSSAIVLRNKHSDKDNSSSNNNSIHAMHPLPPTPNPT